MFTEFFSSSLILKLRLTLVLALEWFWKLEAHICTQLSFRKHGIFSFLLILFNTHLSTFFFSFWSHGKVCGDLSSLTRDWTRATSVKVQNPNHWAIKEFLIFQQKIYSALVICGAILEVVRANAQISWWLSYSHKRKQVHNDNSRDTALGKIPMFSLLATSNKSFLTRTPQKEKKCNLRQRSAVSIEKRLWVCIGVIFISVNSEKTFEENHVWVDFQRVGYRPDLLGSV